MSRMTGIRQHLRVTGVGEPFEVFTKPFDYDLHALTAKKHGWPDAGENPVGYLLFLAWSAARRTGAIDATLTFERFKEQVEDLAELDDEDVDPTPPAAGAG
jgi:hypothetical protein